MIYVTGDIHGDPYAMKRFNAKNFPEQKLMTKDDYVIVVGDFGWIWSGDENNKEEKFWLKWLDKVKPFKLLFIEGNHENHYRLNQYPVEEWNGGKIHRINNSVFHLMRGQVFTIDNLKFFTMGGASSVDIKHRKEGISWWREEIPSRAEFEEGLKNLDKHNWIVDVVLTHTCPTKTLMHMSERFTFDLKPTDVVNGYLDQVEQKIGYKHWFFGHFHQNVYVGNNQTMLYNSIVNLEECLKESN